MIGKTVFLLGQVPSKGFSEVSPLSANCMQSKPGLSKKR